jgi:hypothetical protein
MRGLIKGLVVLCALLGSGLIFQACTSGGVEDQYAKALSDINKDWQLYEVKKQGDSTIIRVEVSDVVSFKDGKKAMIALQKIDPQLTGYIEFYNAEVGMVLRKVEIFPSSAT